MFVCFQELPPTWLNVYKDKELLHGISEPNSGEIIVSMRSPQMRPPPKESSSDRVESSNKKKGGCIMEVTRKAGNGNKLCIQTNIHGRRCAFASTAWCLCVQVSVGIHSPNHGGAAHLPLLPFLCQDCRGYLAATQLHNLPSSRFQIDRTVTYLKSELMRVEWRQKSF